jgi:hypothetical protein
MNKHMTTLILGSYDRQGKSALLWSPKHHLYAENGSKRLTAWTR